MKINLLFLFPVMMAATLVSLVNGQSHVNLATTGSCVNADDTGLQRCAMQSKDCEPTHVDGDKNVYGERWYSFYRQSQRGSNVRCRCANTPIGACVQASSMDHSDSGLTLTCAAHEALCAPGETFFQANDNIARLADCKCHRGGNSRQPTQYGACVDRKYGGYFCSYRFEDCPDEYDFVEPSQVPDDYRCHCGNVKIGGCVGGFMKFQCAASEDDCTHDSYFSPVALEKTHGYTCLLCDTVEALDLPETDVRGNSTAVSISISISACITFALLAVHLYLKRKKRFLGKHIEGIGETKQSAVELPELDDSKIIT